MSEAEMVEAVELDVYPNAAATMTEAGRGWFGRTETEEECRERTGARVPLMPTDTYLLVADFAEHDEKFGSTATIEVSSDPAPTREETARLAEQAMQAGVRPVARRRRGRLPPVAELAARHPAAGPGVTYGAKKGSVRDNLDVDLGL